MLPFGVGATHTDEHVDDDAFLRNCPIASQLEDR